MKRLAFSYWLNYDSRWFNGNLKTMPSHNDLTKITYSHSFPRYVHMQSQLLERPKVVEEWLVSPRRQSWSLLQERAAFSRSGTIAFSGTAPGSWHEGITSYWYGTILVDCPFYVSGFSYRNNIPIGCIHHVNRQQSLDDVVFVSIRRADHGGERSSSLDTSCQRWSRKTTIPGTIFGVCNSCTSILLRRADPPPLQSLSNTAATTSLGQAYDYVNQYMYNKKEDNYL